MSFRLGQRVRAIATLNPATLKFLGALGTIVGPAHDSGNSLIGVAQPVRWDEFGLVGAEPVKCLAPVDDPAEFKRFMERVLKPVKLPKEVMA